MCYPPLIAWLPLWWLSQWQLGAFTTSAARLAAMTVPRVADAAHTAALAARADAEAESERRSQAALQHAQAAAAARHAHLKGQLDALRETPRPDCRLPDDRLRNLNAAVDAANTHAAPGACATPCPPLPALTSPDEPAAVIWTFELIDTAGQCMRLHDACRGGR